MEEARREEEEEVEAGKLKGSRLYLDPDTRLRAQAEHNKRERTPSPPLPHRGVIPTPGE